MQARDYSYRNDPVDAMPPKVLHNVPNDDDTVTVEWALPGLRRGMVRVPAARWVQGEHLTIGKHLTAMLSGLDAQDAAVSGTIRGSHGLSDADHVQEG